MGVCVVLCHRWVARAAAGVSWTSRTTSAPWAARALHTSVIDAAGAIYIIGGQGSTGALKDVYVSADGGAGRTRAVLWGTRGALGHALGSRGVLGGY